MSTTLTSKTEDLLGAMEERLKKTYGRQRLDKAFAAPTPAIEQKLVEKITESSELLSAINTPVVSVENQEKVIVNPVSSVSSRVDTNTEDRVPLLLTNPDGSKFTMTSVNNDYAVKYSTLNNWSKFPDFEQRVLGTMRSAIAISKVKCAWNGTSVAVKSDRIANPLGEDVSIGFLQRLREYRNGSMVVVDGATSGQIKIGGPEADFPSVDAMCFALLNLIPEHLRIGLTVYLGSELRFYNGAEILSETSLKATERAALNDQLTNRTYGTLSLPPTSFLSFFPVRGVFIGSARNLSLYTQDGSTRQRMIDNPKRDQYEYYNTVNEAFVIEDEDQTAMAEHKNIVLWSKAANAYL